MSTRRRFSSGLVAAGASAALTGGFARGQATPGAEWEMGALERLGFDPGLGDEIVAALPNFPAVTGVCVVRHGLLAFEHYIGGYTASDLVDIRSVTKSVTSALVGIAIEQGDLDHIDVTVGEAIPHRIPAGAAPGVAGITLQSFLSMTSGLWWDGHADWGLLLDAENWVENTLRQPIVADQGSQFIYNTGGSHLAGVMLAEIVGRPLEDYAAVHLFVPLGIEPGDWMRSPQGEVNGGSGLELLPRDMAKLGHLLMANGEWFGGQVVDSAYSRDATTRQSDGEAVTGGSIGVAYGFQWWVTGATGHEAFFALGFGGQYVYVVPALELVVVVAAGFEDGETPFLTSHRPIPEQIVIPAIRP